ncbi:8216_t:CDS:2 [Entrophospora sp. SA101]|nr:8216_t:CDS:2 [Entrophospora sp. SA101]
MKLKNFFISLFDFRENDSYSLKILKILLITSSLLSLGIFTIFRLANNDISTKIEFKNKDEDFDLVLHISSLNDFNISTTSSECLNYVKYINNTSDFPYISDIDIVKCIPEGETIYIDLINLNITDLYDTLMNFYSVGNYTKRSIKIANNYYYDIYFKKKIIQKLIQNWKSYLGLFLEYDNEIKWEFNSLSTIPSLSNMTTLAIRPYSPILEIITEIKIYTVNIVKCIPEGETIYIDLINLNITDLYDTLMNFYSVGNYTKRSIKIANNYYYDIYFKKKIIQKLIQNWKSYLGLFLEYDNEIKWEFNSLSTIPSLSNMTTLAIRPYSPILEIITEIKIYTLVQLVVFGV